MTEAQYSVQDLISTAFDQKPVDFENAFSSLIVDRIAAAVEAKKVSVAQSMFGDQASSEDYSSDETEEDSEVDVETEQEEEQDGEIA
ncbi:hypothetical protein UFOVP132_62 [uncultured Caudovirales phage]|jgi:hypothetical protein|uniref:Uncharacterized protein n=1 Tax=uncultured Caudovirales phage TaxID=2100421 RepID=A0A6J5L9Q6_9CAUD|nr:hypothetical protein UFOVP132_62 [uncultured Caudovirales phage]